MIMGIYFRFQDGRFCCSETTATKFSLHIVSRYLAAREVLLILLTRQSQIVSYNNFQQKLKLEQCETEYSIFVQKGKAIMFKKLDTKIEIHE